MYSTFDQHSRVLFAHIDRLCLVDGRSDEDTPFFAKVTKLLENVGIHAVSCVDVLHVIMTTLFLHHQSHADLIDPILEHSYLSNHNPVSKWFLSKFLAETGEQERFYITQGNLHQEIGACETREIIAAFLQAIVDFEFVQTHY